MAAQLSLCRSFRNPTPSSSSLEMPPPPPPTPPAVKPQLGGLADFMTLPRLSWAFDLLLNGTSMHAQPEAPPADDLFPCIIFSHGLGANRSTCVIEQSFCALHCSECCCNSSAGIVTRVVRYSHLASEFASNGFVVLCIEHRHPLPSTPTADCVLPPPPPFHVSHLALQRWQCELHHHRRRRRYSVSVRPRRIFSTQTSARNCNNEHPSPHLPLTHELPLGISIGTSSHAMTLLNTASDASRSATPCN